MTKSFHSSTKTGFQGLKSSLADLSLGFQFCNTSITLFIIFPHCDDKSIKGSQGCIHECIEIWSLEGSHKSISEDIRFVITFLRFSQFS